MQALEFDGTSYLSEGKRIFLISGEIHYFRVRPEAWRDRLEKWKAAGGNCVATYVPWLIHEPEEGRFNFDDPEINVGAFLKLCQELDLWVVVRPGPYQYSELAYDGLPGWLCKKYPEILARDLQGKAFRDTSVSYVHPKFLEKARLWYANVIPLLAKHQVHLGGAVAAAQFDNELMGMHRWFSGMDYHPDSMGVGREEGPWADFLKGRYNRLEDVSAAWNTPLNTWAEALPIAPKNDPVLAERRRMKDYQDYYYERIADYAQTLAGWMREEGIQVPLVHNSPNPDSNADFEAVCRRLGKDFLLGSDHYYNLNLDWETNNPSPKYAARVFVSLQMLRHLGVPPTVFELPGGSLSDYPPITAHDASCAYLANLALGMKGYNYYIFAGGANRPGTGTTGEIYDFGAALSPSGEVRDLYYAQMGLAEFLKDYAWLAGSNIAGDFRIGVPREYSRGARLGGVQKDLEFTMGEAWDLLHKGLVLTAACAGLSPDLVDLEAGGWEEQVETPLALACCRSLSRGIQEKLARFLDNGGKLLLAPVMPDLDENFQPCGILAEALGGTVKQRKVEAGSPRLKAWGVENIYVNGSVFIITSRPANGEPKAKEERTNREAGYLAKVGGRGGMLALLGLNWKQGMREHERMLAAVLGELGCVPRLKKDNPNLWAVLRTDGKKSMLFVLNLFSSPMTGKFEYVDPVSGKVVDCGEHELPGVSVLALSGKKAVYKTWAKTKR